MEKRTNPYTALLDQAKQYCKDVKNRKEIFMWFYEKKDLAGNFRMDKLYAKVEAAKELGFNVELRSVERGLEVWYVENVPEIPWRFR